MALFVYNENIPFAPNNPSVDQPDMETNTNSIKNLIEVDHQGFNVNQGGFHTVVHCIDNVVDPAPVPPAGPLLGAGEVYTKTITTDSTVANIDVQEFYQSAGGVISQMTGNLFQTSNLSDGYMWSSGILIQWGFVAGPLTSGTANSVTFKNRIPGAIPFPNKLFAIQTTLTFSNSTPPLLPGAVLIRNSTASKTSFSYLVATSGGSTFTGFSWVAIGN